MKMSSKKSNSNENVSDMVSIASTSSESGKELTFQLGMERDMVIFEGSDMESLRELAGAFIESKYPHQTRPGIVDAILLFKHNYLAPSQLELLQSVDQLEPKETIEVVLKLTYMADDCTDARPHMLFVHSYKSPTFCDYCAVMLFGLVRQGLKCDGCGGNFHKRCAFKIPSNCSGVNLTRQNNGSVKGSMYTPRRVSEQWSSASGISNMSSSSESAALANSSGSRPSRRFTMPSLPRQADSTANKLEIPHTFVVHTYKRPTVCHVCRKLLVGIFRQGYQCKDCKFNCHKKHCVDRAPRNCLGELAAEDRDSSADESAETDSIAEAEDMGVDVPPSPASPEQHQNEPLTETVSNQIPLQRIAMSVRHNKKRGSKILKAGWMVHYTGTDQTKRVHYWRLDSKFITLFTTDTGTQYYKAIALSEILSVDSNLEPMGARHDRNPYLFTLKTSEQVYYCGERDMFDQNGAKIPVDPHSGKGTHVAISWAEEIRKAYQSVSVTPQSSLAPQPVPPSTPAPDEDDDETDISQVYQVFPDEILGSGQFGIVYGGVHRKTGKDAAIKVIDKFRFPTKEERALKNEVDILKNINHPAVVNLQRMFETTERIFVVMEKMKGDMLEMILSSPKGRLSEPRTKVLVHQILVALHFLHSKNIVHCDLKPENVLLSGITSKSGNPQIKLCDFGFSRIIGRESFRRSVVGTPAYLAPEVLSNRKYNRSLDMWSVGVIIYVSVSGTFPFNEEEEISDQIQNAAFMYPRNPWAEISMDARDLIDKLLQVKMNKRLSSQQALLHIWMQDYHTWLELRSLEQAVGERYLTHESADEQWQMYGMAIKNSIPEDMTVDSSKNTLGGSVSYL